MKKPMNARLTTAVGTVYDIVVEEEQNFSPTSLTEKAIWRFIMWNGDALVIQGNKIDNIVIEQKPRSWWRR